MATTEQRSRDFTPTRNGLNLFVDGETGSDLNGGLYPGQGFKTIGAALLLAAAYAAQGLPVESIRIGRAGIEEDDDHPGFWKAKGYDEQVTIPRSLRGLTLIGEGNRGAVFIAPQGGNKNALTVHADDVTLVNVGTDGEGTGASLTVTGARFRTVGSKVEGGTDLLVIGPGTIAQIEAGTHGDGADALFEDTEFCWSDGQGVVLQGTDYGAATQPRFVNCKSHNIPTAHLTERVGTGGSAAVTFADLEVDGWKFLPNEDGSMPTKFVDLDADAANSGVIARCLVPVAIDSGKNTVGAGVVWLANEHPAARSNGQPS